MCEVANSGIEASCASSYMLIFLKLLMCCAPVQVLVDDGSPVPAWLKDRRFLNPLLTAYDERIIQLDSDLRGRVDQLNKLQQQVGTA